MSTPKSRRLESIREEEARLMQLAAEGDTASSTSDTLVDPTQSTDGEPKEPFLENPDVTAEQDARKDEVKQDLEYWKSRALESEFRFGKYKSKTDATIYELRMEVKTLQGNILNLTEQIKTQIKEAPTASEVDDLFGPEVVSIIGEEASEAIKKAVKSAHEKAQKLETKLLESEQVKSKERIVSTERQAYEDFIVALESFVPECRMMNTDPEFLNWLDQEDATGVKRLVRLQAAQRISDVERVASFFNSFKELKAQAVVPPPRKDTIASRTGPVQRSSSTEVTKPTDDSITVSFIRQHEIDVARGKFKGRASEKRAIDERIEKAYLSGKIINK
jgi:hypothetical protein